MEREAHDLQKVLRTFDDLRALADDLDGPEADRVEEVAWRAVREADPIRVLHAQQLLGVSEQTVREWIAKGVLVDAGSSPQRVTLESVLKTKLVADELRELGRDRDLVSVVLNRIELEELQQNDRFLKSLEQMRRGERGEWPEGYTV